MAVVAVLVFVAAYILIATERVPKSRALLLADLSGRGFCSGSKTREGRPMDDKCKPEAARLDTTTTPRMSFTPGTRRSIGSFHAASAGAWNGDSSVMEVLAP
jgi:hypothetical protein